MKTGEIYKETGITSETPVAEASRLILDRYAESLLAGNILPEEDGKITDLKGGLVFMDAPRVVQFYAQLVRWEAGAYSYSGAARLYWTASDAEEAAPRARIGGDADSAALCLFEIIQAINEARATAAKKV